MYSVHGSERVGGRRSRRRDLVPHLRRWSDSVCGGGCGGSDPAGVGWPRKPVCRRGFRNGEVRSSPRARGRPVFLILGPGTWVLPRAEPPVSESDTPRLREPRVRSSRRGPAVMTSPMSKEELERLHLALLSAFPTHDDLALALRFGMDVRLEEVAAPNEGLSAVAFAVIQWAEGQGRLGDLVATLRARAPENPLVAQLPNGAEVGGPERAVPRTIPASPASAWKGTQWGRTAAAALVALAVGVPLTVLLTRALRDPHPESLDAGSYTAVDSGRDAAVDSARDAAVDARSEERSDGGCAGGLSLCGPLCVDTRSDPNHCGGCRPCLALNRITACEDGGCVFRECAPGWDDCDHSGRNGCEVNLSTSARHCGACGHACPDPDHGRATCATGQCSARCNTDYGDCDGDTSNGCETYVRASDAHCGRCHAGCDRGMTCGDSRCETPAMRAFRQMTSAVRDCGQGRGERVTVEVDFDVLGRATRVEVAPPHGGTAVGRCVVTTIQHARPLVPSSMPVRTSHTFQLR